jgi:cell wall-associated NlpC family hydrolase
LAEADIADQQSAIENPLFKLNTELAVSKLHQVRQPRSLVQLCGTVGVVAAAFLIGCAAPPQAGPPPLISGDPTAPSQVTPAEALAIAEGYSRHAWQPFARNIMHGRDVAGVQVDTPDATYRPQNGRNGWWVPGELNEGIPYKWGGFDDLASFDRAIAEGRAGGDVSTPAKRMADNKAVSAQAAGLDCSGFVSRCLKLPEVRDSSQLPGLCDPLPTASNLQPGDLLNIPHRHVLLFAGWASPDHSSIYYYETGGIPDWKPALKESPLQAILDLKFQPLHYRGMARQEVPSGKEVLTRSVRASAVDVPNPVIGDP